MKLRNTHVITILFTLIVSGCMYAGVILTWEGGGSFMKEFFKGVAVGGFSYWFVSMLKKRSAGI